VSRSDMLEPSEGENATEVFQEAGRQKSVSLMRQFRAVTNDSPAVNRVSKE
jgi:hypothetical protein